MTVHRAVLAIVAALSIAGRGVDAQVTPTRPTTPAATPTTVGDAIDPCQSFVLAANAAAGVGAFGDVSCLKDPTSIGCFASSSCRFCRHTMTQVSRHYVSCDPVVRQQEQAAAQEQDQFEAGAALDCAALVSSGDKAAGLSAFYDTTCPAGTSGGLGCQGNLCRFCKTFGSSGFIWCPTGTTTSTTPTTTTTTAPAVAPSTDCSAAVVASRLLAVSSVAEPKCATTTPTIIGCVASTTCQLCRTSKNEANQYLISCKVLQDLKATTTTVTTTSLSSTATVDLTDDDASPASKRYVWMAAGVAALVAAVVAVLAIHKSRWRRQEIVDTPRTPVDIALMDPTTCLSSL